MALGVEEVDVSYIITLFGIETPILAPIIMSEACLCLDPLALNIVADVINALSVEGLEIALSSAPLNIFISVDTFLPLTFLKTYLMMIMSTYGIGLLFFPLLVAFTLVKEVITLPIMVLVSFLIPLLIPLLIILLPLLIILLPLLLLIFLIRMLLSFDFPTSFMLSIDEDGLAVSVDPSILLLGGLITLNLIPAIEFEYEW